MTDVLLVDDEDALRRPMSRLLERAGFSVTHCAEGGVALEHMSRRGFDVLVLDMHLRDMTGFDVLETMQQKGIRIPRVVAITGDPGHPRMKEISERGVSVVLAKPFTLEELRETLKRVSKTA